MRNLSGLIGPYGGTKESEFRRPITMTVAAIGVLTVMLLLLVGAVLLCGQFIGPVVLLITSLLSRNQQPRPAMQAKVLNGAYWAGAALTVITLYLGGFPVGYEVGEGRLWVLVAGWASFSLPLWVDTFRWLVVVVACGAEVALGLLLARLLTEILFPSLPNSVRAVQGTLNGIVPFMRIKNFDSDDDDISIDDGVFPESVDAAPLR